jgi:hypothetical protein
MQFIAVADLRRNTYTDIHPAALKTCAFSRNTMSCTTCGKLESICGRQRLRTQLLLMAKLYRLSLLENSFISISPHRSFSSFVSRSHTRKYTARSAEESSSLLPPNFHCRQILVALLQSQPLHRSCRRLIRLWQTNLKLVLRV